MAHARPKIKLLTVDEKLDPLPQLRLLLFLAIFQLLPTISTHNSTHN